MQAMLKSAGLLALLLTLVPPVLFATGALAEASLKAVLLGATVLWFSTAPFFLKGGGE